MDDQDQKPAGSCDGPTETGSDADGEHCADEHGSVQGAGEAIVEAPASAPTPEAGQSLPELEEDVVPLGTEQMVRQPGEVVTLGSGVSVVISAHVREFAGCQVYSVQSPEAEPAEPAHYTLFEAFDTRGDAWLQRQGELMKAVQHPVLPKLAVADATDSGHLRQLVNYREARPDLASLLASANADQVVLSILPILDALSLVHQAGWVVCGLCPSAICPGKPPLLTDISRAIRIGERSTPFAVGGYTAPEISTGECLSTDASVDTYSIGAILYQAFTGDALTETVPDLMAVPGGVLRHGAGQILHRCLGPQHSRYADVRELAADLRKLRARQAGTPSHQVAAYTDIGQDYSRSANQDAFAFLTRQIQTDEGSDTITVACVADGMGGMAAGEKASAAAVHAAIEAAARDLPGRRSLDLAELRPLLQRWARTANAAAWEALGSGEQKGGCTVVLAAVVGARAVVAHCGDCRAYLLDGAEAHRLSRDHSVVMGLVVSGEITIDALRSHPSRSIVTRSLGESASLPESYVEIAEAAEGRQYFDIAPGQSLLLCSDGLWEPVEEAEMAWLYQKQAGELQSLCTRLVQAALSNEGTDNITALIIRPQIS